jgi:hypothetical protein
MLACAAVVWFVLRGRYGSVILPWLQRFAPAPNVARAALYALAPAFAAQIVLLCFQVRYENGAPLSDWMQRLPIPVYDHHTERSSVHQLFSALGIGLGAVEVCLLAAVAVACERGIAGVGRRSVPVVAAVMAAIALGAPAMSTSDPYEYVAAGMLGLAAYLPPHGVFDHTIYGSIAPHIPMEGVLYGPVWLLIDTAVTFFVPTILAKLIALRVLNALLLVLLLWLLARAGTSRTGLVAIAVNPALWYYVVANPHADIECLVAVAAAFLCSQRARALGAILFVCAAGLIKFPFIVAGAAAFAPFASVRRRLLLWGAAVVVILGVSYVFPGPVYLHGVAHHATFYAARAHAWGQDDSVTMIPLACLVMVAFVVLGRGAPGAAWFFGQLSPLTAPWYLLWGMPYALATRSLVLFLVPIPLLAAMRDQDFIGSPLPGCIVACFVAALLLDGYLVARRRFVPLEGAR